MKNTFLFISASLIYLIFLTMLKQEYSVQYPATHPRGQTKKNWEPLLQLEDLWIWYFCCFTELGDAGGLQTQLGFGDGDSQRLRRPHCRPSTWNTQTPSGPAGQISRPRTRTHSYHRYHASYKRINGERSEALLWLDLHLCVSLCLWRAIDRNFEAIDLKI